MKYRCGQLKGATEKVALSSPLTQSAVQKSPSVRGNSDWGPSAELSWGV